MAQSALQKYKQKRNFDKTPEPKVEENIDTPDEPIFVIHKHHYTKDKYFLRLESHGVLKSWVIPKGISLNPNNEQFARRIEDHPISYAEFEGKIPKSESNVGKFTVVDKGTYENIKEKTRKTIQKDLKEGKIQIWLEGEKIKGGFEMKEFRLGQEKWLFKKLKDNHVDKNKNAKKLLAESVL